MLKVLALIIFSLVGYSTNAAVLYSIEDLRILSKQKNYKEFLQHAKDIRPSERSKEWKEMLVKNTEGLLNGIIDRGDYSTENFKYIERIIQWPSLRNEEFIRVKRKKIGLKFIEKNKKNSNNDYKDYIRQFWNNTTNLSDKEEIGLKVANILKNDKKINLWNYLKYPIRSDFSKFYCQKELVQSTLLKRVELYDSNKKKLTKELLTQIAHKECWDATIPVLKKIIFSKTENKNKMIPYTILSNLNYLDQTSIDLFLTLFILNIPQKGEVFNTAWNNLNKLGQSFVRRNNVLNGLYSMDPLPGKLFSHSDTTFKNTILRHFHSNVPEYMNGYAKNCIDYLSGEKKFKNGNPTIDCKGLFESTTKSSGWVKSDLIKKYKTIKTF